MRAFALTRHKQLLKDPGNSTGITFDASGTQRFTQCWVALGRKILECQMRSDRELDILRQWPAVYCANHPREPASWPMLSSVSSLERWVSPISSMASGKPNSSRSSLGSFSAPIHTSSTIGSGSASSVSCFLLRHLYLISRTRHDVFVNTPWSELSLDA